METIEVLYSPNYGAGWYTWNQNYPQLLVDPEIIKIVKEYDVQLELHSRYSEQYKELCSNKQEVITRYVENTYSENIYCGGARYLTVLEVDIGDRILIGHRDGFESVSFDSRGIDPELILLKYFNK